MMKEWKFEMLVYTFCISMIAFLIIYFSILSIFDRMNSLTDVEVRFSDMPNCYLDIPKPTVSCETIYTKVDDDTFLLDGENCVVEMSGDVRVSCKQRIAQRVDSLPIEMAAGFGSNDSYLWMSGSEGGG